MPKIVTILVLIIIAISCDTAKKETAEEPALPPIEVPPSYLSVRINFPVNDLESGINQILPKRLIDGAFPMKDNRDTLFLTIQRTGNLDMNVSNNKVLASIPINVTVSAKKSVMGITFSNRDSPVTFSGTARASTVLDLTNDWNLGFNCSWEGFDFKGEPEISIMGFKVNVEKAINKIVDDYSDYLSDIICRSLRESVSLDNVLNQVWSDLQSTHRIAKNPKPLYIRSSPAALNGTLIPKSKDTLSIHLEYRTKIHVSPENRIIVNKVPLNERMEPLSTNPTFLAYPELFIPYPFLEDALNKELKGQLFQYEKYKATIESVGVTRKGQSLEIELFTEGDLRGKIYVKGKPALNEKMELTLENFKYQIDAENDWLKMTDFALHQFAERYISEQIRIDLTSYFNGLDELIMQEIGQSPLGDKMALRVSFVRISSYNVVLTETGIQWILSIEGKSSIDLKEGLLNRRKSK